MDETYRQIRQRARELVQTLPEPAFYKEEADALKRSHRLFDRSAELKELISHLEAELDEDFGHGLFHSQKVAIEAGAIVLVERRRSKEHNTANAPCVGRLMFKAHCAGLLHDTMRKHKDHAEKGAAYAEKVLAVLHFPQNEIHEIAFAIACHEAFKTHDAACPTGPDAQLLADALYDADKFRWGPDNFSHTVWDMVSYARIPLPLFMSHYPRALEGIARIKKTFRSQTGKLYGPGFIDIGLDVGKKLYTIIQSEFAPNLGGCTASSSTTP
ncbi:HD domain-containing protein [Desulfoluna spongiiphila]|uniref:hypothetical protein n=1 Tax=Desulfoluna spongiiphila TaxID=419481 RepID=UPI001252B5CD|nr:hypothetical protein [Desulfoluna spongiiphila]VVS93951.1 hypothetical protein DBB_35230 [Desulfoluna spongiiphila]